MLEQSILTYINHGYLTQFYLTTEHNPVTVHVHLVNKNKQKEQENNETKTLHILEL